jgi:hypothetical protein
MADTKVYRAWAEIIRRVENPRFNKTKHYMGRGIKMYPEWRQSFEIFYAYIGDPPSPKHSIDRINNDGNYEPGNIRWATHAQQMRNRRSFKQHK